MYLNKNLSRGILVDDSDKVLLQKHLFCISDGYPVARVNGKYIKLHKLILTDNELKVDHKNRVRTDNRRTNLRYITNVNNARNSSKPKNNTSGYKGVSKTTTGSWGAQIRVNYKIIYLGTYVTKEEAALVYDIAAKKHHKEFAVLNFNLELH